MVNALFHVLYPVPGTSVIIESVVSIYQEGIETLTSGEVFEFICWGSTVKTVPAVVVELNLHQMDGHQVMKKRNVELIYGTKDQLHVTMVMKLDPKWACEKHRGENGDIGHCWINPNGNHTGLNMGKKKMWASAIVAGEATIYEPPNTIEFDGVCDGRLSCPRGGGGDTTANMVLAAVLPFVVCCRSSTTISEIICAEQVL
ncbi:hypothetical protein B0H14DRAFT_2640401 [Mycena olivaceomarginata]|nr:hypothetical protein B0H14DRAFT_2640401 [Mycena olivaceomarginata]